MDMCVFTSTIIGIKNANSLVWYSVPYRIYSYIHIIYEYSIVAMLCVVTLTPAICHAILPLLSMYEMLKMCVSDSKNANYS